jgi:hypothetical protein
MVSQSSGMVRASAFRRIDLSSEKAFSVELKSDCRVGGRASVLLLPRCFAGHGSPLAEQLVEDYDVASSERGREHLVRIRVDHSLHRSIEDHRRDHSCQAQCARESCRFPVPMRNS